MRIAIITLTLTLLACNQTNQRVGKSMQTMGQAVSREATNRAYKNCYNDGQCGSFETCYEPSVGRGICLPR